MRKLLLVVAAAGILLVLIAAVTAWRVDRFMTTPVNVAADGQVFEISPGSSFTAVARKLVAEGYKVQPPPTPPHPAPSPPTLLLRPP